MSQKETTGTIGRLEASESQSEDLTELAELARQAFEQKRTKDCLDLTRAMLLIDPDNADARSMRLSIQSEMHRDLDSARTFLRQVQSKETSEPQLHLKVEDGNTQLRPLAPNSIQLPAVAGILRRTKVVRRSNVLQWSLGAGAIVVAGFIVAALPRFRAHTNPVEPALLARSAPDVPRSVIEESRPAKTEPPPALVLPPVPAHVPSMVAARAPSSEPGPVAALPDRPPDRPVVTGMGILAISSPTSVDIYENDAYLGSVPVSLELSAGAHTLEYRHGTLRKIVTHVINRDETAKAMITFDVSVQINSRPWAEVYVDGVERKDLGQTPLSGARVPIGGVLIFENPQFQAKRYRITGNETGIQVVFP